MSLTDVEHVFAGVHEDGVNDCLIAFFTALPRYFNYGASSFMPAITVGAANVVTINLPGIPGGI
jgi:hypothetical protein